MSKIAIRPYLDKTIVNMGLEKYGQVVMEGISHKIPMWSKEYVTGSGIYIAITGLNEMAPELNDLSDELKDAKILQIRTAVAMLEGALASNKIEVKSKMFWKEVKLLQPDNVKFWSTIGIQPSNDFIYLDETNPEDIIKIFSIEAGGFPEIAPSYEAAKKAQKTYKWYLDKFEVTIKETTKVGIVETRAGAKLLEMFENNLNKLRLVCKAIDPNSVQYKKSTPAEVMFGNMSEYIKGVTPGNTRKTPGTAENFIKIADLDMETLKLRALVKDSSFYGHLVVRSGQIYEHGTETALGVSVVDAVEFLKNVLHDAILQRLLTRVEKYWNE